MIPKHIPPHTPLEHEQRWALPQVPFLHRVQSTCLDVAYYSPTKPKYTVEHLTIIGFTTNAFCIPTDDYHETTIFDIRKLR